MSDTVWHSVIWQRCGLWLTFRQYWLCILCQEFMEYFNRQYFRNGFNVWWVVWWCLFCSISIWWRREMQCLSSTVHYLTEWVVTYIVNSFVARTLWAVWNVITASFEKLGVEVLCNLYLKRSVVRLSCSKSARHWLRQLSPPVATRHYYYCYMHGSCIGMDHDYVIDVVTGSKACILCSVGLYNSSVGIL